MTPQELREREADRLDGLADTMQEAIDHKRAPLSQNWTPRRGRIKEGQIADAERLERVQRCLRGLALAHRENRVPGSLASIDSRAAVERTLQGTSKKADTLLELAEQVTDAETVAADAERERALSVRRQADALRLHRPPGFFPSPPAVVERVLELAGNAEGTWGLDWLEPSAGMGHLALPVLDALRRQWAEQLEINPSAKRSTLTVIERDRTLFEYLGTQGLTDRLGHPTHCQLMHGDCLELLGDGGKLFDRIVMNPPFEKRQDERHVEAMYALLRPSWGRLVSVMTPRGAVDCQERLGGYIEELPDGAFAGPDAFRKTGVRSVLYVVER